MSDLNISVAIATYNSNKYIIDQLKSIIDQSIPVNEVVITDDCSSDNTVEIINNFIDQRKLHNWTLHRNEKNLGYAENFKRAISKTSGDIIILCDHDDLWLPNKVSTIKKYFSDKPEILALATSFIRIDENGREKPIRKLWRHSNNNLIRRPVKKDSLNQISIKEVAVNNISPGCCCAFRASIKDDVLKYETSLPHDWQINFIASVRGGLFYLDLITTKYRIYEKNTIGLNHQPKFESRLIDCTKNLEEKKSLLVIAEKMNANEDVNSFLRELIDIFQLRVSMLKKGFSLKTAYILFKKSINNYGLWESVLFDILTILKKR
jgi:glycosyltransferase involved in cell wall biosynthesis